MNTHVYAGASFSPSSRNPFFRHDSIIMAVRNEKWKLIAERLVLPDAPTDTFELYDLARDAQELTNVSAQHPGVVDQLKQSLRAWLRETAPANLLPGF